MKVRSFEHIIRAVANGTNYTKFLVVGSQAILGHCIKRGYDFSFHDSIELDISPIPDNELLSDEIDGIWGENSNFHMTHGYYAHGVGMKTAIFPMGWDQRCCQINIQADSSVSVFCPSPEDLLISKMIAGREKDVSFIKYMIADGFVDEKTTLALLDKLPVDVIGVEKALYVDRMIRALFQTSDDDDPGENPQEVANESKPPALS